MPTADKRYTLTVPLLQDAVLATIREFLTDGKYKPGDRIKIAELADLVGSSAPPVREALKVLQSEGRLTHEAARGYTVRRFTTDELAQLSRLSTLLEAEVLRDGVPRLTEATIDRMRSYHEEVEGDHADPRQRLAAHRKLHFAPFDASRLSLFADELRRLWDMHEHYRLLFFDSDKTHRSKAAHEHVAFIDACATGNTARAIAIAKRHRAGSLEFILEAERREDRVDTE